MYNLDETCLHFEIIPRKVITKKGAKSAFINSKCQEKQKVTGIFMISADSSACKPLLVYMPTNTTRLLQPP